jgi:DNA-binding NarL/FixJ family response regulator
MATQRVFVIWTHPLFLVSVRLLLNHPNIELVGASSNYAAAQEELSSLQPDCVIVEEVESNLPAIEMDILKTSSWVVRLIGLNLDDNRLNVYHREQRSVVEAGDLLHLILNDTA